MNDDDYCDMGDDEPNTSACSGLLRNSLIPLFTCINQDYYIEKIFSSRVNDGICDCCDGSDEISNKNLILECKNICKEIGEIKQREESMKNLNRIKGLAKKDRLKSINENKLRLLKDQYEKGKTNLPKYKETLKVYRSEIIRKDNKDLKMQESLIEESIIEINNSLSNLNILKEKLIDLIGLLALRGGEEAVELTLNKIAGNFIDSSDESLIDDTEALYIAMNYQKVLSTSINVDGSLSASSSSSSSLDSYDRIQMISSLALKNVKLETLSTILPEIAIYTLKSGQLTKSFDDLNIKSLLNSKLIENDQYFSLKYDMKQLNRNIKELETDISNLSHLIKDYERMKQKEFGPDKILYEFWNKCYNYSNNNTDYSYNICPFQDVKQNSKTILGRYSKFILEKGSDNIQSLSLLFTQGDRCMSLPSRRPRVFQLYIECSSSDGHNIVDILEVETCKYIGKMKSVIGCW